jgi:transposase
MRSGRPKEPLILTSKEGAELQALAKRPTSDQRTALRARIVLESGAGLSNADIAKKHGVTTATVAKWRARFISKRLEGLVDAPRPGARRKITPALAEHVLAKTFQEPPPQGRHWTTRLMAKELGLTQNAVLRIWKTFGVRPRESENLSMLRRATGVSYCVNDQSRWGADQIRPTLCRCG